MATADLGVRILLEDGASAGLGTLGLGFAGLNSQLHGLMATWANLDPLTKASGLIAGATGLAFAGLGGILLDTIHAGAQLQDTMANMDIAIDGAREHSDALKTTLQTVADSSIFSSQQVGEAFVAIGQHGFDATQIINGLGQATINLAEAIRTDPVTAANLLSQVLQQYHLNASDATDVTNLLDFAFEHGIPSASQLQGAFAQLGGSAFTLGVPLQDLIPVLDMMAQDLGSGTKAGTALRYMLDGLAAPTSKSIDEMAALGIVTVNKTSPALRQLITDAENAGGAGKKLADNYDGTVTSLGKMFTAAQNAGTIKTDQTFLQWASANGLLNDKLFDSQGKFIGLSGAVDILGGAISNLNPEQKAQALQAMFNVRGNQAVKNLTTDLQDFNQKYATLTQTEQTYSASKNAQEKTSTLNGEMSKLKTTVQSLMANIGLMDTGPLAGGLDKVNGAVGRLVQNPGFTSMAANLLAIGTAASGALFGVSGLGFTFGAAKGPVEETGKIFKGAFGQIGEGLGKLSAAPFDALVSKLGPNAQIMHKFTKDLDPGTHVSSVWQGIGADLEKVGRTKFPGLQALNADLKKFPDADPPINKLMFRLQALGGDIGNLAKVGGQNALGGFDQKVIGFFSKLDNGPNLLQRLGGGFMGMGKSILGLIPAAIGLGASLLPILAVVLVVAGAIAIGVLMFTRFRFAISDIVGVFQKQFQPTIDAVKKTFQQNIEMITKEWDKMAPPINAAMGQLINAIKAAAPVFGFLAGIIGGIIQIIIAAIGGLVKGFIDALPAIISVFTGIFNIIANVGKLVKAIFTGDWGGAIDALKGIFQGFGQAIGGIFSGIWTVISTTIGNILGAIGHLIDGMKNVPLVGGILNGGKNILSHIPGLAAGGVVTGPTLAMIGEGREPEVVLPVSKLAAFMDNYKSAGTGAGGTTVINNVIDGQVVGQIAVDHMTGQVRQMGAARMFR